MGQFDIFTGNQSFFIRKEIKKEQQGYLLGINNSANIDSHPANIYSYHGISVSRNRSTIFNFGVIFSLVFQQIFQPL
jgi:hypothetical protein